MIDLRNQIVAILLKHEDELSDGYHHYAYHAFLDSEKLPNTEQEAVPIVLNKIADEILSLLV